MPDPYAPSEFGGKVQPNRVQPFPHEPTASEQLMLTYTTGDDTGSSAPDKGEVFTGILPAAAQREILEAQGLFKKGEVWDEMTGGG